MRVEAERGPVTVVEDGNQVAPAARHLRRRHIAAELAQNLSQEARWRRLVTRRVLGAKSDQSRQQLSKAAGIRRAIDLGGSRWFRHG
jgi:hypothetical protein